jgi:hypothetical protein
MGRAIQKKSSGWTGTFCVVEKVFQLISFS